MTPGVNYGVLYMRPIKGAAMTKTVDWIGNNYGFESYSLFENITIVGAEGATVDAIEIEGGTYYYSEHSQADIHPVMLSLIELKNVKFDGITFTGKGGYDPEGYGNVINLSGNNIKVDGLTLNNCVLKNSENNARLLYKTESTTHLHKYAYNDEEFEFRPSMKDITVTGCTFNGGYMGMELRETENITITKNVFNVANRNILLPVNTGFTYSGKITITDNVSNNAKERFVRGDGTGDAVVVITDNIINNYQGKDPDYIKVTNGNNLTIENNILAVSDEAGLSTLVKLGGKIVLANDIELSNSISVVNANFVLDGNGHTIRMAEGATNSIALFDIEDGNVTFKNITFDGIKGGAVVRTVRSVFSADNVTVKNCQHTANQGLLRLFGVNTLTNCRFEENTCKMVISLNYDGTRENDNHSIVGCVFKNNTCSDTGVILHAGGSSALIDGNKFLNNTSTVTNGATLYIGSRKNSTITDNIFDGNTVTATSAKSSGGIVIGNTAVIENNCFINNKVTVNGQTGYGNDVCVDLGKDNIDLSDNYWGGSEPKEFDNYYTMSTGYALTISNWLSSYEGY